MPDADYKRELSEAVRKASAAENESLRRAYLDLADFYRRKLNECWRSGD